jgi:phosphohistidine phosphatase
MRLMLMRHGDALETRPDASRALSSAGIKEVRCNAMRLQESCWKPWAVVTSPLRRAVETGQIVSQIIAREGPSIVWDELVPGGDCRVLLRKLAACQLENPLLVTHQPLISTFIEYLTGESVHVNTAYIAGIKLDEFSLSTGQLQWFLDTPA